MTNSSYEARGVRFVLSSDEEISNILSLGLKIKKSKDTLLFQTLKVESKRVS